MSNLNKLKKNYKTRNYKSVKDLERAVAAYFDKVDDNLETKKKHAKIEKDFNLGEGVHYDAFAETCID